MDIYLPKRFDRDYLSVFFNELDSTREEHIVNIHFSTLTYSLPTAMLIAGSKLREWVNYRSSNNHVSVPHGIDPSRTVHSYLMHLGFFDFIYMEQGNHVGQARGSAKYLPITRITTPPFIPNVTSLDEWHQRIKEESRRLAGVLAGNYDDTEELRVYSYSIREIIRNVFEHSNAHECYICGQRWVNGHVEIAILDEGIGIARTISDAHSVTDDLHALDLALMPGISRTNLLPDTENIFGNSGFGLYILSNLASSFGWFALGSGSGRIIGYGNTIRLHEPFSFRGTFFGMRLNTQPHNFRAVLDDIISAGENESGTNNIRIRASGMSRIAE